MNRLKQLTHTILRGLIFLAAFSASAYAQVCLPVTQPDLNAFKRFEDVEIWESVGDRVFFTAGEDSWTVDSEGHFRKIGGVTGAPWDVLAVNDWFLILTTRGTWVVTREDRATKLVYPETTRGFSADDWILVKSKKDELLIITVNGSSAVTIRRNASLGRKTFIVNMESSTSNEESRDFQRRFRRRATRAA
jgi:hypothetical protein